MMPWRVMVHALADSFRGIFDLGMAAYRLRSLYYSLTEVLHERFSDSKRASHRGS